MINKQIAKRYANAILNAQKSKNNQKKLLADVKFLQKIFSENKEVIEFLHSNILAKKIEKDIFKNITSNLKLSNFWSRVFELLLKKHKFLIIVELLDEIENQIYHNNDQIKVNLTLAEDTSEKIINQIKEYLKIILKKDILFEIKIDPDIIGGFVAETESMQIDGSIRKNLVRFKNSILENN